MSTTTSNPSPPHVPKDLWAKVETLFFKCGGLTSCTDISEFLEQPTLKIHVLPSILAEELKNIDLKFEEEQRSLQEEQQQEQQQLNTLSSPSHLRVKRQHSTVVMLDRSYRSPSLGGTLRQPPRRVSNSKGAAGGVTGSNIKRHDSNLGSATNGASDQGGGPRLKLQDSLGRGTPSTPHGLEPRGSQLHHLVGLGAVAVESTGECFLVSPISNTTPTKLPTLPKREARFNPVLDEGVLAIDQLRGLLTALCQEDYNAAGHAYSPLEVKARRDREICQEAYEAVQVSKVRDGELILGKTQPNKKKKKELRRVSHNLSDTINVESDGASSDSDSEELDTEELLSRTVGEEKLDEYLETFGLTRGALGEEESRLDMEAALMVGIPRDSSAMQNLLGTGSRSRQPSFVLKSLSGTDLKGGTSDGGGPGGPNATKEMTKERFLSKLLPPVNRLPVDLAASSKLPLSPIEDTVSSDGEIDPSTGSVSFAVVKAHEEKRREIRTKKLENAKNTLLAQQSERTEMRLNLEIEKDLDDDTIMLRMTPGNTPRGGRKKKQNYGGRTGRPLKSDRQRRSRSDEEVGVRVDQQLSFEQMQDRNEGDGPSSSQQMYSDDGRLVTAKSLAFLGKLKQNLATKRGVLGKPGDPLEMTDEGHSGSSLAAQLKHTRSSSTKLGSGVTVLANDLEDDGDRGGALPVPDQQHHREKRSIIQHSSRRSPPAVEDPALAIKEGAITDSRGRLDPEKALRAYLARRQKKPRARTISTQTDCYSFTQLWLGSRNMDKAVSTEDRQKDSKPGQVVSLVLRRKEMARVKKLAQQQAVEEERLLLLEEANQRENLDDEESEEEEEIRFDTFCPLGGSSCSGGEQEEEEDEEDPLKGPILESEVLENTA